MRVGIVGGSFDPVHYGHLLLAESCREQVSLQQVWFVPAATPPHKTTRQLSAPADRVAMLELAIAGHSPFLVRTDEIQRGGVSYTVETLEQFHLAHPEDEFFLLMGADSLGDLPNWRDPDRICQLALPVVVRRPDWPMPQLDLLAPLVDAQRLDAIRRHQVDAPLIQLSSTDIRQRVATSRSIRFRTPRAVEQYIYERHLYAGGSVEVDQSAAAPDASHSNPS